MSAWSTLAAILVAMAGFAGLALAMDRHHAAVLGGLPSPARRRALRLAGTLALSAATLGCVHAWGVAGGAVGMWGVASVAAAAVMLWLRWREPTRAARPRSTQSRRRICGDPEARSSDHGGSAAANHPSLMVAAQPITLVKS